MRSGGEGWEDGDSSRGAGANSLLGLAAWEGVRLLGILRCVGYEASVVFLQDLLVYPERQRQGVGTALFQAMLGRFPAVYQLELLTDATEKTDAFYRAQGLRPAEELGCRAYIRM